LRPASGSLSDVESARRRELVRDAARAASSHNTQPWRLMSDGTTVSVHDGLAVYRFGRGEPLLLMPGPHRFARPGLPMTDALINGLTALGREVLTWDPPGSGRSTRRAELGMMEMHECADEAVASAGFGGALDAVGHSMSGLALLAYAIERPRRVRRLVLIGTGSGGPAYMTAPGALWNRTHPKFWRLAALGVMHIVWPRLGPERLLNNFIHRESFCDSRLARTAPVTLRDWLRPREGRADWHRVAKRLDYSSRLPEVGAATLVLCGRHDPQFPPACSEELAHGIRRAELTFFERSGHYPFVEEAERFWPVVGAFLARAD
jgi:pimeloyl-ACP methyl ester carboxylesterase